MSASSELDRIWSHTTQNGTDIVALQLDVARIRKLLLDARIERPAATRQIGDYLPDPVRQQAPAPDYGTERTDDCGCPASDELREKLARIEAHLHGAGVPDSPRCTAEDTIIAMLAEFGVVRPFATKTTDPAHSYRVQLTRAQDQLATIRALLAEAPPLSEPPTVEQLILVGIREAIE